MANLITSKAPNLPLATVQYEPRYQDQFANALRLYFNQVDNAIGEIIRILEKTGPFNTVTANTVNTNVLNANQINGGNISAGYTDVWAVGAYAARFGGLDVGTALIREQTSDNIYANYFHGSGRYIDVPYNQFQSNQDQSAASIANAYALTLNVDDFPNGIHVTNNSRITFSESGQYLITYSLSFTNSTNDRQDIDIWFRYKGNDIANSNSRFIIPQRKSSGANSYLIAVTPFMIDVLADGDYVEIMWRVSDVNVTLEAIPAVTAVPGVTPAIPATPSALVAVQFMSAQHPVKKTVTVLPIFGFGEVGDVTIVTR